MNKKLEFKNTGKTDNYNRPIYTTKRGTLVIDTNCGKSIAGINNGLPYYLHTKSQDGEPDSPVEVEVVIVDKFTE
jgi:hypothetical protein